MKPLPVLTLIPAGAGSGKTYRIKEQLAEWVENGQVQPDRIAAVTFTETAASELRGRIRATLMERGRLEDALRLDQSFISTIHGFGRRLLIEYAFEAGNCPNPRLLAEDEERLLIRKAVSRIERIEPLSRKLHLFGYRYNFTSGATDVEQFRQRILSAIHMLRIIGGDLNQEQRLKYCLETIKQTYGPVGSANILTHALLSAVKVLLAKYPSSMGGLIDKPGPKADVEEDFRILQRAAQSDALNKEWGLWARLGKLKVYKNDKQLPADYQDMAREVIAHAGELYRHPGPLDDALLHGEVLLKSAWDALSDYAGRKREKGIIDYTDMIDGASRLIDQPEVLDHLSRRFDCLVIDEFQDTNPIQFSFLWRLHKAGVPALIVGDLKQSIMGFQSADPRLMGNLIEQYRKQCAPLDCNWRSQASLMKMINALGSELFGSDYASLTPKAEYESQLHPVEAIRFDGPGIKHQQLTHHVAAQVKSILSDETATVFDRHLKKHRRIRGEDIAILGLTHGRLKGYADALRKLDICTRLAQDGWFMSREIQLAYYGLSFVADTQDRHAALYLAVTELGEDDLTSATQTLLNGDQLTSPMLERLKGLSQGQRDLTVSELVARTLNAMGLFDLAATWFEANQVRANLLRLIGEAQAFVSADREALAGGGYHGSGLKTFLSWLDSRVEEKDGDRKPDAQAHDEDAVQLLTWHASKGKEWPVVIVATLDRNVEGKLPSLDIQYTDFSDLSSLLDNARLEFSPSFDASETKENFKTHLDEKAREEGLNLLYVALTRAREQLIFEWQENLKNSSRYTYWHLLQESGKMRLEGNELLIGEASFPCRVIAADRELPNDFDSHSQEDDASLPRLGRRTLKFESLPEELTPLFVTPSGLHGQEGVKRASGLNIIEYGKPLELSLPSGTERGLLIHRVLELLGQQVAPNKVRALIDLSLIDDDWIKIQKMADHFMKCIEANWQPKSLHWEAPITARSVEGSVIYGTIDMLVENQDGFWIVDHKSDEPKDLKETFNHYLPQLNCYARALSEGVGLKVNGIAIHWACLGSVSTLDF